MNCGFGVDLNSNADFVMSEGEAVVAIVFDKIGDILLYSTSSIHHGSPVRWSTIAGHTGVIALLHGAERLMAFMASRRL